MVVVAVVVVVMVVVVVVVVAVCALSRFGFGWYRRCHECGCRRQKLHLKAGLYLRRMQWSTARRCPHIPAKHKIATRGPNHNNEPFMQDLQLQ